MLEGLEAVEISLNECKAVIDFRIDANTYRKSYLKTEAMINGINNSKIEDISASIQNFGAYSLTNYINFGEEGIPFLMTKNIRNNYIDWNIEKYVDNESHKMLYKSHCSKGQVLVTMAGEYLGRVAVYDKDEVCSSNQAIAKVTLNDNMNPYIVSTFLNSIHGQNQINRLKTITGQPNINMSLIASLKIPHFNEELTSLVESTILSSTSEREKAELYYSDAENILIDCFDGLDLINESVNKNTVSFSQSFLSTGRLDAEYYQPKYERILETIKNYSNGYTYIYEEFTLVKNNSNKELPEYNYVEIGDVNVKDGSFVYNLLETTELPANAKIKAKYRDILISKVRPNRGAITIIDTEIDNLIVSGAFTVLRQKTDSLYSIETLKVLLRTKVYKELLLKFNVGTQYPVIIDENILQLPIPKFGNTVHNFVVSKLNDSSTARRKSEQLLEIARVSIELAIEQDEETAINYIKENTKNI